VQEAQQDAEKQHRIKEDDFRRKYKEKCIMMEDKNRKTRDEERKREQQKRKSRDIVQQIPLWDDKTDVESYLLFELSMKEAMQPEDQWIPILRKRLTGKALATYRETCPTPETLFSE